MNPPFKLPVRLEDEKFIVAVDSELICNLASATYEEKQFIVAAINNAPRLLAALKNANELITQLMPGAKYLAIQDYGFLNTTCIDSVDAVRQAERDFE